jgi:hypothetical protein
MKKITNHKSAHMKTPQQAWQGFSLWALCITIIVAGCSDQNEASSPVKPIHQAIVEGDLEAVQDHIATGCDLNERDPSSGSTPLITAATFGRTEIGIALMDANANINLKNNEGSTALITAAFFCHKDFVQHLLDRDADTGIRNNMGATALNTVEGPWEMVKPIYDMIGPMLKPLGLELDDDRIQSTRPIIADLLRQNEAPSIPEEKGPDFEVKTIVPRGDENYILLDSDYIFDQQKLPTFELRIPGSALAEIDADPAAENYVAGSLTFEGETISPVGIRYKGSVGAWAGCLSGFNFLEPSGHKICTKLSMKIKINWNGSGQTFYGLKKIQLHSQKHDPSQMRERLGYWLFHSMGVPAPRSIHARLLINGKFVGLYALTEQIDDRFAQYHFEDGSGNLYKEVWPLDSNGKAREASVFLEHLKTNEDHQSGSALIHTFAQELQKAEDSEVPGVLSQWTNIDEMISYAVVDRTIRHDDGPFHWYCQGNTCFNHNYYWYENPTEQRLHLIPWDLDSTFQNIRSARNPITVIADDWGEITADGKPFMHGPLNIPQRSAAADKLIGGWVRFEDEYERHMARFMNGPFSKEKVDHLLHDWIAQIRPATLEASKAHKDAVSMEEWERAVADLRTQLDFARSDSTR